jgi:hypothetical protein
LLDDGKADRRLHVVPSVSAVCQPCPASAAIR